MLIFQDDNYEIYQTDGGEIIVIKKTDDRLEVHTKDLKKVA